jgi:hypothetical protein
MPENADLDLSPAAPTIELDDPSIKVTSVSASILSAFFDELAKTDTLQELAEPLRKLVLDDNVFAESAVKAAMFPTVP